MALLDRLERLDDTVLGRRMLCSGAVTSCAPGLDGVEGAEDNDDKSEDKDRTFALGLSTLTNWSALTGGPRLSDAGG